MSLRLSLACPLLMSFIAAAALAEQPTVDFLKDVKPILVQRCYRCHSSLEEEGGLRVDSAAAILKGGDGGAIVVPGKSGDSRLIAAVLRTGDLQMPPEGDALSEAQINVLKAWIDAGAPVPPEGAETQVEHWSFAKPVRPEVPAVNDAAWAQNPIDAFIAAKHEELKLTPVGEAPKNLLLRRVYLDLIGLPPTPEELQEILRSASPSPTLPLPHSSQEGESGGEGEWEKAYEAVVDKLLASPHYGERWGRHWMDVWRYSDWDGYGNEIRESKPHIWRWRDWIVESLNADKPYDRMVQEMLAADELTPGDPNALRATGYLVRSWYKFNRNKWLDDAVEHTGKAFLGMTFNCARCHDHMYDPVQQREYYTLRAIFEPYDIRTDRIPGQVNPEQDGLVRVFDAKADAQTFLFVRGNEKEPKNEEPLPPATPAVFASVPFALEPVNFQPGHYYQGLTPFVQDEARTAAQSAVTQAKAELEAAGKSLADARKTQADLLAKKDEPKTEEGEKGREGETEHLFLDRFAEKDDALWKYGVGTWEYKDGKLVQSDARDELCGITTQSAIPRDFVATLRYKTTGGDVYKSVGIAFDAAEYKDFQAAYLSVHSPGPHRFNRKGGADSYPASAPKTTAVAVGQEVELKLAVRGTLANVWVNGTLAAAFATEPRTSENRLIFWTYDATAEFLEVTVDTLPATLALVDKLDGVPIPAPVLTAEVAAALVADAEKKAAIAEKSVAAAEVAVASLEARIAADAANYATPPAADAKELSLAAGAAERKHAALAAEIAHLRAELAHEQAKRSLKTGDAASEKAATDALAAVETARKAFEAAQMAATQPTEAYTRLTPVHPTTSTGRRLALARWITSNENPLTARVAINHLWLRHMGSPLAPSVFDFGLNGKPPTNQALLDWLAVELMENGWHMKPIHKQIVMSRAYRLASTQGMTNDQEPITKQIPNPKSQISNLTTDPENLYYWRANPRRMEAEIVRDATLYVAGSLDVARGGPDLDQASGLTVPRRSIYFRASKEKRMEFLSLFDSANPVECYRRSESIAPQQALAMANSTLTLAQARLLAKKISESLGNVAAEEAQPKFIDQAFVRILCRPPTDGERRACLEFLDEQAARLADARSLTAFSSGPAASVPPSTDPAQRARENLIHVLFNHNDFVTVR